MQECVQHGAYSPKCLENLNLARINFNRIGNYIYPDSSKLIVSVKTINVDTQYGPKINVEGYVIYGDDAKISFNVSSTKSVSFDSME